MKLDNQKRLAAKILKCSKNRIVFDTENLEDIKESITKADIKSLISGKAIKKKQIKGSSKSRIRKNKIQKRKGRRKGYGSRKGKVTARLSSKEKWMNAIRLQRRFLKELRDKEIINKKDYRDLYMKSKGGFFRSKNHIKLFIEEHNLAKKNEIQ